VRDAELSATLEQIGVAVGDFFWKMANSIEHWPILASRLLV
jgi:hypothetical protein